MADTTAPGFPASEPLENQGLRKRKSRLADNLTFVQVNEVTVMAFRIAGDDAGFPACAIPPPKPSVSAVIKTSRIALRLILPLQDPDPVS